MAWFKCTGGGYIDYSNTTVTASAVSQDSNYTYLTIPNEGIYNTSSKVRTLNSNILSQFKYFAIVSQCYGLQAGGIAKNDSQYKKINNNLSIEIDAFKIEAFKVTAKVAGKFGYLYGKSIGGAIEFNVVNANAGDIIVNKPNGSESTGDMIMICVFKFD